MDEPQDHRLPARASQEPEDLEVEGVKQTRAPSLDWSMVEHAAKLAFDIWVGQPELAWAKKAFNVLLAHGLLEETSVFSRHVAFFRFLVLGGIYRDFCQEAWDETSYIDYAEWASSDEIVDRFVVGQLFAKTRDWDAEEECEYSLAVDRLIEAERDIVVEALVQGFGSLAGLYASLWQSREAWEDEEDPHDEDEDDCFEPDDVGKAKAYEWVTEWCPRLADIDG